MRPKRPTRAAALVASALGVMLFAEISSLGDTRVVGVAVAAVAVALLLFGSAADVSDDDVCSGCSHRRVEHHGICQACQRDVVNGRPGAPRFACGRFERVQPGASTSAMRGTR